MRRREFLFGAVALAVATPVDAQTFANGIVNQSNGTFDWTVGGGDPLRRSLRADGYRATLAIGRLNLSPEVQAGLRQTILTRAPQRFNLAHVYEGQVMGDVMVSGNGTIALRPRLLSRRWPKGRSRMASWWSWTSSFGEHWEITIVDVCGNPIITRVGNPVPCVCEPTDACA